MYENVRLKSRYERDAQRLCFWASIALFCQFSYRVHFSFFFSCKDLFNVYEYDYSCLWRNQKRALDPITDGCKPPRGCWDLNSGPLEEQSVLLTTGLPCQPPFFFTDESSSIVHRISIFSWLTSRLFRCLAVTEAAVSRDEQESLE
jgi:hypothetical protein